MPTKSDLTPKPRAELICDTAGSILSVRVRGEIDHHTAADIRRGIDALIFERRPKRLLLDLSAVSFMDSSGLGLIMGRLSVLRELGGDMTVWNPSRETLSILTLAGMERLLTIEYPPDAIPPETALHKRTSPAGRAPAPRKRKKPGTATADRGGDSPREGHGIRRERKEKEA